MTKLASKNPAQKFEVIGEVEISTQEEISSKVQKAHKAFSQWKMTPIKKKIEYAKTIYTTFIEKKDEIAELITKEMGKPVKQSRDGEVPSSFFNLQWYIDHIEELIEAETTFENDKAIHKVFHEPFGVATVISPWNFPFYLFIGQVIPNLLVGNTVVYKASEECILLGKLIEETMEKVGLPEGVFSMVHGTGDVGEILTNEDVNIICFTGSSAVGKKLYKKAAEKFIPVVLEMGGSSPGVVFEDADIEEVFENIFKRRFYNCGQVCTSLKRLILHKNLLETVIEKVKKHAPTVVTGNPESDKTDIGPLVNQKQLELFESQVQDAIEKGAEVLVGGNRVENLQGAFHEPTVLSNISFDMRVWKEEVFGPALPIVTFKTEEEAIQLANDTPYGLSAYVYTKDQEKALRVSRAIDAGSISMNSESYGKSCNPFGGFKASGMGREQGKYGVLSITQTKVVALQK